jgi:sugar lactone lactonase YvrE
MRNGKGYLSLVSQKGEMLTASWVSKLNAPAGMAVHDGKLYVVDINVIRVIDLQKATIEGAEVAHDMRLTPQPRALNDIAISTDGQIFVSDSARHQVLRVEEGVTSSLAPLPFQNANGLHFQDGTLFVGGKQLWRVSLSGGTIKDITPRGLTDIDGIQSDGKGGLMISVVGGPVWHLPLAGPATRWTAEGVSSANMGYLPKRQLAIIPTGFDNSLIAFRVP